MNIPDIKLSDKRIFWLGALTMYGFPLIGWLILKLFAPNVSVEDIFIGKASLSTQILWGSLYGVIAYLIIHLFIFSGVVSSITTPVLAFAKKLNWIQILFLSLAAGVGEELLFRGVIQHFIGIWPTAILFVAIHGYINPTRRKVFFYGLFMIVVSAGFGYFYRDLGIYAAIIAHFVIDLLIFSVLKTTPSERFFD